MPTGSTIFKELILDLNPSSDNPLANESAKKL